MEALLLMALPGWLWLGFELASAWIGCGKWK